MKIGLLGYYGANAYCDDYLELIIKKTFNNISKRKNGNIIQWIIFQGNVNTDINGNSIDWNKSPLDAVIMGGGSILGVDYGIDKLKHDIPFYIYGSGFRECYDLDKLKQVINRAIFISLRGNTGIQKLKSLSLDTSKVEIVGDPIFLCTKNKNNTKKKINNDKFIGGVYRPYITHDNQIKNIFEYLQNIRKEKVRLFSFAKSQGDDVGGKRLGFETIENLNLVETYNEMTKSSFWFGNRLHPFCISLINEIPTIGLDIEFNKVESVCSTLDYSHWIKNENLNLDTFKCMYIDLIDNHEKINKTVQIKINEIKNNLELFAEKIFNDIENRVIK